MTTESGTEPILGRALTSSGVVAMQTGAASMGQALLR